MASRHPEGVLLMRKLLLAAGTVLALLSGVASPAIAGSAEKATGSIVMSGPVQAATFNAFETTPVKGSVTYTNFEYAAPGSGVWVPTGTFDVGFFLAPYGGPFTHTLTVDGFTPTSPTSLQFWGHGYYYPNPAWTETFTGTITGDQIEFTMVPDDGGALYGWTWTTVTGVIAANGSVSGTWSDDLYRTDVFEIASIGFEAFSYTAPVTWVDVAGSMAAFDFTIPTGVPLAGTPVHVHVTDGGSPGIFDTWAHGVVGGGTTDYPITAGNLTVFGS